MYQEDSKEIRKVSINTSTEKEQNTEKNAAK